MPIVEGPLAGAATELGRKLGCPAFELLHSEQARVQFLTGVRRPAVILPARLVRGGSLAQGRAVLAHELCHLRSRDLWLGWLRAAACILWWPNPVVRSLSRLQVEALEERCDDQVVGRG